MDAPSTFGLTRLQRDALRVIQEMTDAGVPPSYAEIARELDLSGRSAVVSVIDALADRGYLSRRVGQARSLTILSRVPLAEEVEFVGLFDAPGLTAAIAAAAL